MRINSICSIVTVSLFLISVAQVTAGEGPTPQDFIFPKLKTTCIPNAGMDITLEGEIHGTPATQARIRERKAEQDRGKIYYLREGSAFFNLGNAGDPGGLENLEALALSPMVYFLSRLDYRQKQRPIVAAERPSHLVPLDELPPAFLDRLLDPRKTSRPTSFFRSFIPMLAARYPELYSTWRVQRPQFIASKAGRELSALIDEVVNNKKWSSIDIAVLFSQSAWKSSVWRDDVAWRSVAEGFGSFLARRILAQHAQFKNTDFWRPLLQASSLAKFWSGTDNEARYTLYLTINYSMRSYFFAQAIAQRHCTQIRNHKESRKIVAGFGSDHLQDVDLLLRRWSHNRGKLESDDLSGTDQQSIRRSK